MQSAGFCFYREVQRFRQPWLWLLILGVFGISIWSFVDLIILGEPSGQRSTSDTVAAIIAVLFGLALPVLFYATNLTTEVRSDGLYIRFFPFHLSCRQIPPERLVKYQVCTYRPIKDYGGWGIRYGRNSKAYNVSGNRGVMLELAGGERLLIGSQRPQELADAISLAFGRKSD